MPCLISKMLLSLLLILHTQVASFSFTTRQRSSKHSGKLWRNSGVSSSTGVLLELRDLLWQCADGERGAAPFPLVLYPHGAVAEESSRALQEKCSCLSVVVRPLIMLLIKQLRLWQAIGCCSVCRETSRLWNTTLGLKIAKLPLRRSPYNVCSLNRATARKINPVLHRATMRGK